MTRLWLGLGAALLAAFAAALCFGDQPLGGAEVARALIGAETPDATRMIVRDLRLPRALLAALVGGALAVAGAAVQALLRNPLAEPGLLGVNAGAALAATIVIVAARDVPEALLPVCAFAGALAMSAAIYALAWRAGASALRLILIGIGLGALAGAAAAFLSVSGPVAEAQRTMLWMAGSLQDSRWVKVGWMAAFALPAAAALWAMARELDLISIGDEVARGLGQPVPLMRALTLLGLSMLSGAAVAAAGPIAFVGLAAPHMARRLAGRGHAALLPASALTGATLLLLADLAARRAMAPTQLPVGLATALLGAPFFGYLLWRRRDDGG